jgi:hypothetical protein
MADTPAGSTVEEILAWLAEIQAMARGEFDRPEQPAPQERDWAVFDRPAGEPGP